MATFFSEYFGLSEDVLEAYGAFNISIVNDLPLFIDPFLLFHSDNPEYNTLHEQIIAYLIFLRKKADSGSASPGFLQNWYCFPEVKQNWLGFSISGNGGSGLGMNFALALHTNLHQLFPDFGEEQVTESSHLEKVCLISPGVGRDNISDFTTNLIKDFLCRYTATFAERHLAPQNVREVAITNAVFNFKTEAWQTQRYKLPWVNGDFVLLSPRDMLTRDENWINRGDLIRGFDAIPVAIPDAQLREQISNYFHLVLAKHKHKPATAKEREEAAAKTILHFPELIDYYIKLKEMQGDEAVDISAEKVIATEYLFVEQLMEIQRTLVAASSYYQIGRSTYEESHARLAYLKDVIENKGGHRLFYHDGKAIEREKDLQILFRLVWFGTPSDAGTEANDGRGPVDFKISRGAKDKTLVEMKLAKNSQLERNLEKQLPVYQAASDAKQGIKAILFFTQQEELKLKLILKKLGLTGHRDIVLIDGRRDNKPSGSKA